jgi:hypothetical protein
MPWAVIGLPPWGEFFMKDGSMKKRKHVECGAACNPFRVEVIARREPRVRYATLGWGVQPRCGKRKEAEPQQAVCYQAEPGCPVRRPTAVCGKTTPWTKPRSRCSRTAIAVTVSRTVTSAARRNWSSTVGVEGSGSTGRHSTSISTPMRPIKL